MEGEVCRQSAAIRSEWVWEERAALTAYVFKELQKQHNAPYCIFDIGSNKGQFLELALSCLSINDFSIHCFEPGKGTFKILEDLLPEYNRVVLNNIGIGKDKSEEVLYYDRVGSGIASLTKRRLDHFGVNFDKVEKVGINTIDNYCSDNKINHIHLLKIDIEGHELDALVGARRMFSSKSIDVVTFEFGGCNIDTHTFFQDFWYFFSEMDFKLFRITPSGFLYPLDTYKEIYEQFRTTNFVAKANYI